MRGVWHVWGRGELCAGFWWENLRERDNLNDLGVDSRISEWILEKSVERACTGLIWLRVGASGELL